MRHDGVQSVGIPDLQTDRHEAEIRELIAVAIPEQLDDAISMINALVEQYIKSIGSAGTPDERTRILCAIARVLREEIRSGRFDKADIDAIRECVQDEIVRAEERNRIANIDIYASFDHLCSVIQWKAVDSIIHNKIKSVGGNYQDVEDVRQEVLMVVYFKWQKEKFENVSKANGFAKTVAKNQSIDFFRKRRKIRVVSIDQPVNADPDAPLIPEPPDTRPLPVDVVVSKETVVHVRDAVERMQGMPDRGESGITHRDIIEYELEHICDEPKPTLRSCGAHFGIPHNTYDRWRASAHQEFKDIFLSMYMKGYGHEQTI